MRLIDADALKIRFRNGESDSKEEKLWNHTVRRMIEEQPTAYDVDKVVEELEGYREEMAQFGISPMLSDIIEVVRNGGVDNE